MSTTVHIKRNEIATNRSKEKNETWVSTRRYAWVRVYVHVYVYVCVRTCKAIRKWVR